MQITPLSEILKHAFEESMMEFLCFKNLLNKCNVSTGIHS